MSPPSFSLAVHNAINGLFSIARKDSSSVTAIVAMQGLVFGWKLGESETRVEH
jgi:hypothetical protein